LSTAKHFIAGSVRDQSDAEQSRQTCEVADYAIPFAVTFVTSVLLYPLITQLLAFLLDDTTLSVIKGDVSQFMQNFFNYNGLLFSFFASTTYTVLYNQQESMYVALYAEVTEARSLMEQLTLITQSRPTYRAILTSMDDYVQELLLGVQSGCPPAILLSSKPANDPLENILYLTSVGLPSPVYDTVKSLREARGVRLGATQRKLPQEHFLLLRVLGALELLTFPLLGAGISTYEAASQAASFGHVLWLQSVIFASLAGCVVLTLQIVEDLRSPTTGLYSLNTTLLELVDGLKAELRRRRDNAPCWAEDEHLWGQADGMMSDTVAMGTDLQNEFDPLKEYISGSTGTDRAQKSLQPTGAPGSLQRKLKFCLGVGAAAAVVFPFLVEFLKVLLSGPALQAIREDNNAQWLQNFFTGIGFVFSQFVTQSFGFLYSQQEQIYLALYGEVSEAKALLEQLTLVCRSRPSYREMLQDLQQYVQNDLQRLDREPTKLLADGYMQAELRDPLEKVLYATSVGVPGFVYDTVRGLREARGARLGSTQRKLPAAHFVLLNVLAILELSVFPVLSAGCSDLDKTGNEFMPGHILFYHSVLFGLMTAVVVLTLNVLIDLWRPVGETYRIQTILKEMVMGLEQELELRIEAGASGPLEPMSSQTTLQQPNPVQVDTVTT